MAGMQRYAQTWSGDNFTAWKTLRYNQKMGLGLALSGVSNTGHDIGGFAGPSPEPELLLRWVQAGILMPRFSIHSWNSDGTVNEPWMYPETTPAIVGMMNLRRALVPLLHDLLWRHHAAYEVVTRPLWLDFPQDPQAWVDGDGYLLGPNLLVAPALDKGVTTVQAYLPGPARWIDLRDDRVLDGGKMHDLPAPTEGLPPILAREGSAHLVDIAPGGFAPPAPQPAVLLTLAPGESRLEWTGYDEASDAWPDPDQPQLWQATIQTSDNAIAIEAAWYGPGAAPSTVLSFVVPEREKREITVNGTTPPVRSAQVLGLQRKVVDWQV
jgi:alpha-glucosidase